MLDTYGLWLTEDSASPPPDVATVKPELVTQWRGWLANADYLLEVAPRSSYIPWTSSLVTWFDAHYRLISSQPGAYLYARTS